MDFKKPSVDAALGALEKQVDALATLCERLISANQMLVERCDRMQETQRNLRQKTKKARITVEQVLAQLKPHGDAR